MDDLYASALPGAVDLVGLQEADPARFPFLLESVIHGPAAARYSILMAAGEERLDLRGGSVYRNGTEVDGRFLDHVDGWFEQCAASVDSSLPFVGGWFLYLGFELAGEIEPRLRLPSSPYSLPDACAVRCPAAVIVDHWTQTASLVAESPDMAEPLMDLLEDFSPAGVEAPAEMAGCFVEDDPAKFVGAVGRIHDYILDGDVFQVNLSRSWRTPTPVHPVSGYRKLRTANPGSFAGRVYLDDQCILSSSPERLVSVADGIVSTRPIAGTRPRHEDSVADADLRAELIAHPKERAEHIMLIDLERNDLGRVCTVGSVEVDEMMTIESYEHVHHIVSNVRGELARDVTPGQVIHAVFPGGTITGCPKVRCMEIIAELEREGRGPYTGSFGYLDRRGHMDLNILIRTAVAGDWGCAFRAGAGIVVDSIAEKEVEETRSKAKGLLRGLGGECG